MSVHKQDISDATASFKDLESKLMKVKQENTASLLEKEQLMTSAEEQHLLELSTLRKNSEQTVEKRIEDLLESLEAKAAANFELKQQLNEVSQDKKQTEGKLVEAQNVLA